MSVLIVNGMVVPCDSLAETIEDIWPDVRAFSGKSRKHRVAIKRSWQVKTIPMLWSDAWGLQCMLSALGHYWPWEGDLYSTKGLAPDVYSPASSTTAQLIANSSAADGTYNPESSYFGQCLLFQKGTTNLLTTVQATIEGSSPYTALTSGDTVTVDSHHFWQGSHSLLWQGNITPGVQGGFQGGPFSVTGGQTYTLSFFAYGQDSANDTLTLTLTDNHGTTNSATAVVYPGGWQRFSVTLATNAAATTVSFTVKEAVSGAGYVINFDGFQFEQSPFACQWVAPGTTTPTAGPLSYTLPVTDTQAAKALTIAAWVQPPPNVAAEAFFSAINTTSTAGALLACYSQTDGYLRFICVDDYGNQTIVPTFAPVTWGQLDAWHQLACIVRTAPRVASGEYNLEIWLDGNLLGGGSASLPTLANINQVYPGGVINNGVNTTPELWQGLIDEFQYLPYAAGPTQLINWFNDNDQFGRQPFLYCTGDFAPQGAVTCVANAIKAEAIRYPNVNTGGNMDVFGIVQFTLQET